MPFRTRCDPKLVDEIIENEGTFRDLRPVSQTGVLRLCLDLRAAVRAHDELESELERIAPKVERGAGGARAVRSRRGR